MGNTISSNLLELQISLPTAIVATAAIAIGIHLFDVYCFERKRTTTFRPLPHSPSESRLTLATAESVEDLNRLRSQSYRFEEENGRLNSSEISRRGQLWRRHASWHIEQIPRVEVPQSFGIPDGLNHLKELLGKYQIDYKRGFLPKDDPLHRLPYARYHVWEDLADDLPKLLGARLGQARYPLKQLPVLATDKLITDAELRRAHLILSLFAHAYVWGGTTPMDIIPAGIAKPLWEVSERLGIPPVLGHVSIVLYNWRRLDLQGEICMENLATLNNFFDGRDESWFYLITLEIESIGASSVLPMMLATDAIERFNEDKTSYASVFDSNDAENGLFYGELEDDVKLDSVGSLENVLEGELTHKRVVLYVQQQLEKIAVVIGKMCESMGNMREGCHPFIFYHRVRPFLSAWKHNPTLPNGVIYEGVSNIRQQFFGGSAAQSALIPFLDIGLGISHESLKSKAFLDAMRDYMLQPHSQFLKYFETIANIRKFIFESMDVCGLTPADLASDSIHPTTNDKGTHEIESLRKDVLDMVIAYDKCVENVKKFRTAHMSLVADYIMAQQPKKVDKNSLEGTAGGKGTGGTELMKFLKPIRDNCNDSLMRNAAEKAIAAQEGTQVTAVPSESPDTTEDTNDSTGKVSSVSEQSPPIFYHKDNGSCEDIDLYRGAATTNRSIHLSLVSMPLPTDFSGQ